MTSYIPQMLSPTTIWQFVASFPQAAASSYALLGHWTSALTGLTPKARQNVHKILALFYRMLLWFWQYAVIVYAYLMHSSKSPLDWEPPAAFLLGTVTRLALFFAPVVDEWEAVDKNKGSKPYLFISNRNVYALDGLPMVAAIYRQTGIWPRFAADTYCKMCTLFHR